MKLIRILDPTREGKMKKSPEKKSKSKNLQICVLSCANVPGSPGLVSGRPGVSLAVLRCPQVPVGSRMVQGLNVTAPTLSGIDRQTSV